MFVYSFRGFNILFVRRKAAILLCGGFLIFVYVIIGSQNSTKDKKSFVPTKTKYNLMEEIEDEVQPVQPKDCTLGKFEFFPITKTL